MGTVPCRPAAAMLRTPCFAALLVCVLGVRDFDDKHGSYEFIYHDIYDVLLTINGDKCYYIYVYDSSNESYYLSRNKIKTEEHVQHTVESQDSSIRPSDMDTVRRRFGDILADFHCTNKTIYTMQINFADVNNLIG